MPKLPQSVVAWVLYKLWLSLAVWTSMEDSPSLMVGMGSAQARKVQISLWSWGCFTGTKRHMFFWIRLKIHHSTTQNKWVELWFDFHVLEFGGALLKWITVTHFRQKQVLLRSHQIHLMLHPWWPGVKISLNFVTTHFHKCWYTSEQWASCENKRK